MATIPTLEQLIRLAHERGLPLPPLPAPGAPITPIATDRPILIAHRGASGYLPEHTLEAYGLAILLGADYIEPDLVMTYDGELVARHDNQLDLTTDVAVRPEFASRRSRQPVDGTVLEGWFSEAFTLAELRTLRAHERIPALRPSNARYDGAFGIPTLAEIIELVRLLEPVVGRRIGLYPETKHPSHFQALGLAMEQPLVATLHAAGYRGAAAPVFLQSFEIANLRELRGLTDLPLIQLLGEPHEQPFDEVLRGGRLTYADMATPAGLHGIANCANGIGPDKALVLTSEAVGNPEESTSPLVEAAHSAGLKVHPYTFRAENHFLPAAFQCGNNPAGHGDSAGEITRFLSTGIDGFFTDYTDIGVAAINNCAELNQ